VSDEPKLPAIGELAYRTYMKAAGCPDDRPFEQACDERARRIWEAVETAVADRVTRSRDPRPMKR
jgi:hypothetical protein